jgi:DNA-binding NarL/FixJ family response regulator
MDGKDIAFRGIGLIEGDRRNEVVPLHSSLIGARFMDIDTTSTTLDETAVPASTERALRPVQKGKGYLSDDQTDLLIQRLVVGHNEVERTPVEAISDRKREAFELIGRGCATEKIAKTMKVSPRTVETYRARIKDKMNLANHTAAR